MRIFCLLILFTGIFTKMVAQTDKHDWFQPIPKSSIFLESEPFPWGNNGVDFKLGYFHNSRHSFAVRYFEHDLSDNTLIFKDFEGIDDYNVGTPIAVALEYRYFPYKNFYAGMWLGYEEWDFESLDNNQKVATTKNYFLTPNIGYLWIPHKNIYLNLGVRSIIIVGEFGDNKIGAQDIKYNRISTVLTIALGLKLDFKKN